MLFYLFLLVVIAVLGFTVWQFGLPLINGETNTGKLFGNKSERRLDVIAHANVDGRRRLVLIRRDNVEHLIMTGGPVDVVIETGIGEEKAKAPQPNDTSKAVFSRQPRKLGQAAASES